MHVVLIEIVVSSSVIFIMRWSHYSSDKYFKQLWLVGGGWFLGSHRDRGMQGGAELEFVNKTASK